jgi:hypothetical protein
MNAFAIRLAMRLPVDKTGGVINESLIKIERLKEFLKHDLQHYYEVMQGVYNDNSKQPKDKAAYLDLMFNAMLNDLERTTNIIKETRKTAQKELQKVL